jgi:hypothetical protein
MIIINVYIIILRNKLIPLNVFAICAIYCELLVAGRFAYLFCHDHLSFRADRTFAVAIIA